MFPFSQLHKTLAKPKKRRTKKTSISPEKGTLGYHIRERRLTLALNPFQAAKNIEVSESTLWGWESNNCIPTEGNMEKIIKFLGYNPIQK